MGSKSQRLLAVMIVVNGCASEPTLRGSVNGFIQQHITVAIKWLGKPTVQQPLGGDPSTTSFSGVAIPTSRHTLLGDLPKFGIGTFYAWASSGNRSGCLINLYADSNGIVTGAAVSGDSQQCAQYADVLNHAARKSQSYCGAVGVDRCIE